MKTGMTTSFISIGSFRKYPKTKQDGSAVLFLRETICTSKAFLLMVFGVPSMCHPEKAERRRRIFARLLTGSRHWFAFQSLPRSGEGVSRKADG
jgi:hypothetical protein